MRTAKAKGVVRALIVNIPRGWTAETEYSAAVGQVEVEMGLEVTVAVPAGFHLARKLAGSARLLELPGKDPANSPVDFINDVRFLAGRIARGNFSIIHSSRSIAHLIAALANRRRVPLVHLRGSAKIPSGHFLNRFLYQKLTGAVIVSSSRIRNWTIDRLRLPPERVHRIFAPVDVKRFSPAPADAKLRAELGIAAEASLIVQVAKIAPIKGQEVLLEALAQIHGRFPGAVLVLVGKPWVGGVERLRRRAKELGIGRSVVFAGRRDDVPRFISAATVCVSSSVGSEENSRAVEEYLAGARPVVATEVGVIPELVETGVSGLLVPPRDPSALGEAIATILQNPQLARRMGREGRRVAVEQLSTEIFARRFSSVLASVNKVK